MDCLEFRRHHLAYVDDTLPGDVLVAAERHRVECAECAALDTRVRRSLLLARNLPTIEPSADFAARLAARLRDEGFGGVRSADAGAYAPGARDEFDGLNGSAPWYAAWYERLARDAGGWGRQAAAAAVVFAAASAGYALRGGREGTVVAGATSGPAAALTGASTFAPPAFGAASMSASAESLRTTGVTPAGPSTSGPSTSGTSANAAEFAAVGVAAAGTARAARTPHAARRRDAELPAGAPLDTFDADGLGTPAYIPLPAGALETGALLGPATAGVPVWPAALLAGEAPAQLRNVVPGAPTVRVVGLSH